MVTKGLSKLAIQEENKQQISTKVFLEKWWWDVVAGKDNWQAIEVWSENELEAYLPIFISNKWIRLISNPRFTPHAGPSIIRKFTNQADQLSFEKTTIDKLLKAIPHGYSIDIRMDPSREYVLPFIWNNYHVEPCFTFQIDIMQSQDDILANMNGKFRKAIRDGAKKLILDENPSFSEMIILIDSTYAKQGRRNPISRSLYESIYTACNERGRGKLLIARDEEGRACAGCFLVFDNSTCYDLMNGRDSSIDKYFGMQFLIWEAIKFAAKSGCRIFDFEGSSIESIESFFRHAGGKPTCYFRITKERYSYKIFLKVKKLLKMFLGYK